MKCFFENGIDGNLYGNEVEVNSHSATIQGLKQGTGYNVAVASCRTEGSYVAKSWRKFYHQSMFTLPGKVTDVKCDCSFQGCASLDWDKNDKATSYQYEIYKYDGKTKIASGITVNSNHKTVYNSKLQPYQFYKVHIRAVKGIYNTECIYGAWSTYNYFASCNRGDISMQKVNNKIKIYWNKVTGATDYTIYMSDKEGSGYEKVITTKKTSLLINKKVKNGKYYYIRIVPNYKVGEKIYSAPINDKTFYSVCIHTAKRGWEIY
jgi:hypothetical protein